VITISAETFLSVITILVMTMLFYIRRLRDFFFRRHQNGQSMKKRTLLSLSANDLLCIFRFLNIKELCRVSRVSSTLRSASSQDILWKPLVQNWPSFDQNSFDEHLKGQNLVVKNCGWKAAWISFYLMESFQWTTNDLCVVFVCILHAFKVAAAIRIFVQFSANMKLPLFIWFAIDLFILQCYLSYCDKMKFFQRKYTVSPWYSKVHYNFMHVRIIIDTIEYFRIRHHERSFTGMIKNSKNLKDRQALRDTLVEVRKYLRLVGLTLVLPLAHIASYVMLMQQKIDMVALVWLFLALFSMAFFFTTFGQKDGTEKKIFFFF